MTEASEIFCSKANGSRCPTVCTFIRLTHAKRERAKIDGFGFTDLKYMFCHLVNFKFFEQVKFDLEAA